MKGKLMFPNSRKILFLEEFSISSVHPDTCNMSPLYAAADKGRTSAIEALLELGADANVETEQAEK